jgi:hypothetical protein
MRAPHWNRRNVLKGLITLSGAALIPPKQAQSGNATEDEPPLEVQVSPVSDHTLRLTLLSIHPGPGRSISYDGSLVQQSWGNSATTLPEKAGEEAAPGSCGCPGDGTPEIPAPWRSAATKELRSLIPVNSTTLASSLFADGNARHASVVAALSR